MTTITLAEVTDRSIEGIGAFDAFMEATSKHIRKEYDDGRIDASDYATVYLGGLQVSLAEAIKYVIGRQLASAQADLAVANISKVDFDKDLIAAEIRNKDADTDNKITDNGVLVQKVINMQKDNLLKDEEILMKKQQVLKMAKEVEKLTADILMLESQKLAIDAGIAKTNKEILVLDQDILNKKKQVEKITAEITQAIKLIDQIEAKTLNIQCDTVKCGKEGLSIDARTALVDAQAKTEKAQTDGTDVLANSIMASKIALAKYQAATEKANVDGSDVTDNSYRKAQIDKMIADATSARAKYDSSIVLPNSLLDGETKLAVARAMSEEANYTASGTQLSNGSVLGATSYLGAKANLLQFQAATEKANVDGSSITSDSYMRYKMDKMLADAISAKSRYDSSVVSSGSLLYGETQLANARAATEKANVSNTANSGSYVKAKIDYLDAQRKTEEKKEEQMKAEAALTRSKYDGSASNGSLIACQAKNYCAQAALHDAEHIGSPDTTSPMGAKFALLEEQKNTEQANTTDASGGILKAKTDLVAIQAYNEELLSGRSGMTMVDGSYLKGKADLINAQASIEESKRTGDNIGSGSIMAAEYAEKSARARQVQAEAERPPVNNTLMAEKIKLMHAQAAEARSKSCRAPRAGSLMSSQIALLKAQIQHYEMDGRAQRAKLFSNMYAVSATQDITLAGVVTANEATAQAGSVSMSARDINLHNSNEDDKAASAAAEGNTYTPQYYDVPETPEEDTEVDVAEDCDCACVDFDGASEGTTNDGSTGGHTGYGGYRP
jgi:hypothetical protein